MAEENKEQKNETPDKDWTDMIQVRGEDPQAAMPSADAADSKILNQEEIDSLFGYSGDDDEDDSYSMKTGVRAILNSSMVSYERLPMLDIVFDRLIRMMSTSLRNFTQ
ncbi:MAG: flagellar motor switch protein FliM, partial [Alphaproteobacteria bacterium]